MNKGHVFPRLGAQLAHNRKIFTLLNTDESVNVFSCFPFQTQRAPPHFWICTSGENVLIPFFQKKDDIENIINTKINLNLVRK